jgi:hypothetical protein
MWVRTPAFALAARALIDKNPIRVIRSSPGNFRCIVPLYGFETGAGNLRAAAVMRGETVRQSPTPESEARFGQLAIQK